MDRPLLSIVIPTRERGETLQHTLATVLTLGDPRFEIIVCDNASTDRTAEIVAAFTDPRLRYSRSDTRLSMPENFERGLILAQGEYVTTLGDDDLIIDENLKLALDCAARHDCDLVHWHRSFFYWGSFPDPDLAGSFAIPNGRDSFPVDAAALLALTYRGLVNYQYLPGVYNSLCRRSFLEKYRDYLRGRYFPDYVISPDIFSALVFCSLSPRVRFLQSPASLSGISHRSNGMSIKTGGAELQQFARELGHADANSLMPEGLKGKVRPLHGQAVSTLGVLRDYVMVVERLLAFTHTAPPAVERRVKDCVLSLAAAGYLAIDAPLDEFTDPTGQPPPEDDVLTYFFRLWSIPLPQQYAGKFSSPDASVRELHQHLTEIGYNRSAEG